MSRTRLPPPGSPRRCNGTAKSTGKPCKTKPITGGFVCRKHGGAAPQVKAKALQRVKDMLADAIDPDRALREAARVAYSNIKDLFDENGALKPMKDWPADVAPVVSSVKVARANLNKNDGQFDDVVEIKLWDKLKALEMLFKKLGLLTEKVEHTGDVSFRWMGDDEDA